MAVYSNDAWNVFVCIFEDFKQIFVFLLSPWTLNDPGHGAWGPGPSGTRDLGPRTQDPDPGTCGWGSGPGML